MATIYTEFSKDYTMQKGDILKPYGISKNANIEGTKEYTIRYNYGDLEINRMYHNYNKLHFTPYLDL